MKLFTRYFRINLIATLSIFLLAGIAFYYVLWFLMIRQVDEDLRIEQREIETYAAKYQRPPEPVNVKDQRISFEISPNSERLHRFSTIQSPDRNERENFRQLSFTLPVGGQWILFKVSKSLEATEHMNRSVIIVTVLTLMAILLVNILINRWQLRRLWQPFYSTLHGVRQFKLGKKEIPQFGKTGIDEFNQLNETMDNFIRDADKEYYLLKEFTENASHELQTPLAVVRSTLDVLAQDETMQEKQSNALQTAYGAIQKMAKLNQSLLLLSKIENRQFAETSLINFEKLIGEKMSEWQELWQGRNLTVRSETQPVFVMMNPYLAEIMLNNLLGNAARHAAEGTEINIQLKEEILSVSNYGQNGPLDPDKLFKRFSKGGQSSDQNGLGLSIIRQIAEVSGSWVSYEWESGRHYFKIRFK